MNTGISRNFENEAGSDDAPESYREEISLIVDDAMPTLSVGEKLRVADSWARMLFGIIPENRLHDTFDYAFRRHTSNYPINQYDMKIGWEALDEEERREREKRAARERENDPVLRCTHAANHRTPDGQILAMNPHSGEDELMPCPHCRQTDHEKWRADQIARYGQIEPKTVLTPAAAVAAVTRPSEVFLSPSEADELKREFNELVEILVEEEAARRELLVVFDEGANVFRPPHRRDFMMTPKDIRAKIERYRQVLEERNGK